MRRWATLAVAFLVWCAIFCFNANAVAASNRLLSASPAGINFGNVNVGSSSTQTITLSNTGNGAVSISQANVTGPGFSISGLSLPLVLRITINYGWQILKASAHGRLAGTPFTIHFSSFITRHSPFLETC